MARSKATEKLFKKGKNSHTLKTNAPVPIHRKKLFSFILVLSFSGAGKRSDFRTSHIPRSYRFLN